VGSRLAEIRTAGVLAQYSAASAGTSKHQKGEMTTELLVRSGNSKGANPLIPVGAFTVRAKNGSSLVEVV
jgi:hypothetical protein